MADPIAQIFYAKGEVLRVMGRFQEAIIAFDQVASRLSRSDATHGIQLVANALLGTARSLNELGRGDETIAVADELILDSRGAFPQDEMTALAMEVRIDALIQQSRFEDAILACDELLSRFVLENSELIDSAVAHALVIKGFGFERLGRHELAIAAYEQVIERFGNSSNSQVLSSISYAEERLEVLE